MVYEKGSMVNHASIFSSKNRGFMVSDACFSSFLIQLSPMIGIGIRTHIFPKNFKVENNVVNSMRKTLPIRRGVGPKSLVDDLQAPGLIDLTI